MATHHSHNVNEEYLRVLRAQSYANYSGKAQSLVMQLSSSSSLSSSKLSEMLLEPQQDSVATIIESTIFPKHCSDLKSLVQKYFDISAKASKICTQLLYAVKRTRYNQQFIRKAMAIMASYASPFDQECLSSAMLELDSFNSMKNPFLNTSVHDFDSLHEEYSSMLVHLNSKKKKVARKIKLIKYLKKVSKIALGVSGSVAAAFIEQPVLKTKKKKISSWIRVSRNESLTKAGVQLDVAAMGTYILQQDFDTVSRMVARVGDEIEHNKELIRFCMERKQEKCPLQEVVKELRKGDESFMTRVEELEEHVYLCLVMINRVRVLVAKEM